MTSGGPKLVVIEDREMSEHQLECPECGDRMTLRRDHFGIRYLCQKRGCTGSHGAHPDGKPVGIPAKASVKRARIGAHETFDQLWKSGTVTRSQAYAWMEDALGLGPGKEHISMFDAATCRRLEEACVKAFPELFPLRAGL